MESYRTVKSEGQDEFIERRSRFIGTVRPRVALAEIAPVCTKSIRREEDLSKTSQSCGR